MTEPADVSVVRGRDVVLPCETEGFPPPTVVWRKAHGKHGRSCVMLLLKKNLGGGGLLSVGECIIIILINTLVYKDDTYYITIKIHILKHLFKYNITDERNNFIVAGQKSS